LLCHHPLRVGGSPQASAVEISANRPSLKSGSIVKRQGDSIIGLKTTNQKRIDTIFFFVRLWGPIMRLSTQVPGTRSGFWLAARRDGAGCTPAALTRTETCFWTQTRSAGVCVWRESCGCVKYGKKIILKKAYGMLVLYIFWIRLFVYIKDAFQNISNHLVNFRSVFYFINHNIYESWLNLGFVPFKYFFY
jgi:hypothetical protein